MNSLIDETCYQNIFLKTTKKNISIERLFIMEDTILQKVMEQDSTYYMNTFGKRIAVCFTHGEGMYLYGTDNVKYMDLIGGIAVNILGHNHPKLVEAISGQAHRLIHCSNLYYIKEQAELAEKLIAHSNGLDKVFITNSGAEANEGAIKLSRIFFEKGGTVRPKIISALNSFHGRTLATVTATGQAKYNHPFRPLPQGFVHVPYNDIFAIEEAVDFDTCAVILEVIQGESGIISATKEYLQAVSKTCKEKGALLIIDEVQTGMGRTGTFFAYEQYGITPDIVTTAKGLGGGVPIGAVLASDKVASGFAPGDHGTTFGGNPLACAAALAVLDEMDKCDLMLKATEMGDYFTGRLNRIKQETGLIIELRGKGLMIGIVLSGKNAVEAKIKCLEKGYLVNSIGDSVIRLLPPLIIEKSDIDIFCSDFEEILNSLKT